jgi:DNA mismatch endonuclease (patch repair protein)
MKSVRSRDTKPEMAIRRLIYSLGYRYRLHRNDLPGNPDIVFPGKKKVIFIHGCFWHGHHCARGRRRPKTNSEYWNKKLDRNIERDEKNQKLLCKDGWKVLVLWECQVKDLQKTKKQITRFLD